MTEEIVDTGDNEDIVDDLYVDLTDMIETMLVQLQNEINQYSRELLIQRVELLESENKFLKEYIKETKGSKEFNGWGENNFGGEE